MYAHLLRQAGAKAPASQAFRQTAARWAGPTTSKAYVQPLVLVPQTQARQLRNPISQAFYNLVLKNNSTYFLFIGCMAWGMQVAIDTAANNYVANFNKGRTFQDVIATFPEIPPNCED